MSYEPNAMMELFRAEVENHSESLTSSLMALERDPSDASILESIMRSAHSLKGAARIVGVDVAVEVAHIMEDCLVAAQRGELSIKPSDIDVLLKGVDLLVQISEATKTEDAEWTPIENDVRHCVQQLKSIRAGKPVAQQKSISEPLPLPPVSHETSYVTPLAPVSHEVSYVPVAESAPPAVRNAEPTVLTFGKMLDRKHAEEMRCALQSAIKSGAERIQYDLSKTTDLDPVGLAFLAASKQQLHELSVKSLEFKPVSDEIQLVLRMSGFSSP